MADDQHVIMDETAIRRALNRIAHEILEKNKGVEDCIFIGIRTRGVYLAKRIAERIQEIENVTVPQGELDVTSYRDDIRRLKTDEQPLPAAKSIDIQGKKIILFDDVLYT